nr:hypothetical protein [Mesorhizobium shangrilense]
MRAFRVLVCVAALGVAESANAADVYTPVAPEVMQVETDSGWTFTVAPYFWAAGLSGDLAQLGSPTIEVDASFSDIFDHLKFGAMAIMDARYGRYSVFGDIMYTKISGQDGTPLGLLATSVEVTSETFAGLVGGGYAIIDQPDARLDIVAGVRVWSVDTEISFSGGPLNGFSPSDGATWVDALAGIRGNYSITPKVFLTGWGLVGAGQADLDWDVAGAVGYRFNDRISSVLGYRALGVDYSDDGFLFDVVQHGPILGLSMHF